ncbi:GGDEF domain-containing protein [Candidatus Kaiserbacteria bacterium]|nr:GGDEF domain-containing protein [Candidatus Kaiserbacteria bacterium]
MENVQLDIYLLGGLFVAVVLIAGLAWAFDSLFKKLDKLKEENEKLKKLAYTDTLTGLMTRRAWEPSFEHMLSMLREASDRRADVGEHSVSVMMIDIDHFKSVNDTFGHAAGDVILRKVAQAIKDTLRKTDLVCRWGGEEIVVALDNISKESVIVMAEKVRVAVANLRFPECGDEFKVTVSIGVAVLHERNPKVKLVDHADAALYEAKESGRDQVIYREVGQGGGYQDEKLN